MVSDYMVDIESMGTSAGDAILSLGVVPMDIKNKTIKKGFYTRISLEDSQKAGFRIDAGTVLWWLQQDQAARDEFKGNYAHKPIKDALIELSEFIAEHSKGVPADEIRLWGNGSAMDNVLVAEAYKICGLPRPWSYRGDMCYRTIKNLTPHIERVEPTVAHHALFDAEAQALTLFKRLEALGL